MPCNEPTDGTNAAAAGHEARRRKLTKPGRGPKK